MKFRFLKGGLLFASIYFLIIHLRSDTVPVLETEVPVEVVTNLVNGVPQASAVISVPVDLSAESVITLTRSTNATGYRARRTHKGPTRGVTSNPPMPPMMASTLVTSEERTAWSDYPPEFVVVPKTPLPDGAKRQWSTTVHEDFTDIIWHGRTNRHSLGIIVSTNHMMRIVKPVLDISEPVPAQSTNSTNF